MVHHTSARTTGQLKRLGCSNLKNLIEENKLIIQDFDIINELSTFVARKGSYEAEEGSHDDLAMCLRDVCMVKWTTVFQRINRK